MRPVSLYDCFNARYPAKGDYIICAKGHPLGNGLITKKKADREGKLICRVCQFCKDVDLFETYWDKEVK